MNLENTSKCAGLHAMSFFRPTEKNIISCNYDDSFNINLFWTLEVVGELMFVQLQLPPYPLERNNI